MFTTKFSINSNRNFGGWEGKITKQCQRVVTRHEDTSFVQKIRFSADSDSSQSEPHSCCEPEPRGEATSPIGHAI